jgi:ABC-type iron transport system FetAB ATPase subunit
MATPITEPELDGEPAPGSARLAVADLASAGLAPFSLTLKASECVGLHGPSGVGKTRLLRAIADLDPHTGTVHLEGVARSRLRPPEWRRRVALLPAESQWWLDRVRDHFSAPPHMAMAELDLDPALLDRPVSQLSSGERQRFALLRLLANRPEVLLLDEPTANLDEGNRERVEATIALYRRETGAAVLWVGHDDRQLRRVAGRLLKMTHAGQAEARGNTR